MNAAATSLSINTMSKLICNACGQNFENSEKFCTFCGNTLTHTSKGKGFAVFSMLLGILSCFYTLCYTFYFAGMVLVVLTMPDIYLKFYAPTNWIYEYGCFLFVIISAVLSLIFSIVASKRGNLSKMKNAGKVLSSIALSTSTITFILFQVLF